MTNNKKDIIEITLLGLILLALVILLAVTGIKTKLEASSNNNSNNNYSEENVNNNNGESSLNNDDSSIVEKEDNKIENDKQDDSTNSDISNTPTDNNQNNNTSTDNIDEQDNNQNESNAKVDTTESEEAVINYLTSLNSEIDSYNDETNKTFRDKAKDIFTTTVDFLFYDGEIKGYTFDELSLSAKITVLKTVASIDNKIDSYFPNYKDTIKEKYTNLKGKIAVLYLETTNKFCDKVGEETCNLAREDFNNMKTSFGYTWDMLKETLTASKDKLSLILSEWYKSIK